MKILCKTKIIIFKKRKNIKKMMNYLMKNSKTKTIRNKRLKKLINFYRKMNKD